MKQLYDDILSDCQKMTAFDPEAVNLILFKTGRKITLETVKLLQDYFCRLVDMEAPEHLIHDKAWENHLIKNYGYTE